MAICRSKRSTRRRASHKRTQGRVSNPLLVPYLGFIRLAETLGEDRLQEIVWGVAPSQSPKAVS
jgi:hypothetical protein